MEFDIRAITDDQVPEFRARFEEAFGRDVSDKDDDGDTRFKALLPLGRTRAAFAGGQIIGTAACYELGLTVPGGTVPMAGTTMVSVRSTHRRRGILSAMMLDHLDDARMRGEPVAGLWASESSIYGRYGYGAATERHSVELDTSSVRFADSSATGTAKLIEADEAAAVFPPIYEAVVQSRPGMLARDEADWKWTTFYDPAHWREGLSSKRFVVHTGPSADDGYAIYRQKDKWQGFIPEGSVRVAQLIAASPGAHQGLWSFLTSIDLFPQVSAWNQPVDDELSLRIQDPRRVKRYVWDALWLRILDVSAALEARAYAADGAIRLGITDKRFPDNDATYEVVSSDGESRCVKVDGPAEVTMNVDSLGSLYLGGGQIGPLARAHRVHGPAEAIQRAGRFFGWRPAPWCPFVF